MSVLSFDAATMCVSELALRHPSMIPVLCTSAAAKSSSKAAPHALLVPCTATVAELQGLLRESLSTKKAVHVFVGDATPAGETAVADLLDSYKGVDGALHIAYTLEGKYGAVNVGLGICGATVMA